MVDFLKILKDEGPLRISDIPEGALKNKAKELGKILYHKKFIKIK